MTEPATIDWSCFQSITRAVRDVLPPVDEQQTENAVREGKVTHDEFCGVLLSFLSPHSATSVKSALRVIRRFRAANTSPSPSPPRTTSPVSGRDRGTSQRSPLRVLDHNASAANATSPRDCVRDSPSLNNQTPAANSSPSISPRVGRLSRHVNSTSRQRHVGWNRRRQGWQEVLGNGSLNAEISTRGDIHHTGAGQHRVEGVGGTGAAMQAQRNHITGIEPCVAMQQGACEGVVQSRRLRGNVRQALSFR